MGKTLQSPSLVLAKPRKDMNNVSFRCDTTNTVESRIKHYSVNQSMQTYLCTEADIHGKSVIPSSNLPATCCTCNSNIQVLILDYHQLHMILPCYIVPLVESSI